MLGTTIPNTGDTRVDAALARIRRKFTDLEDALIVQAHLEKRAAERVKEHQILAEHESWMRQTRQDFDEWKKESRLREKALDERIQKLVSAMGGFISNRTRPQ